MTVLYFAHARQVAGVSKEQVSLPSPVASSAFWELLVARHPGLAALRSSSRLARDNDFLSADAVIGPDDEIAIIPPVSGG